MTTIASKQEETFSQLVEQQIKVGGALLTALETIGEKFGFYDVLSDQGPVTPEELASGTGVPQTCTRMWLETQHAGDCLDYDPATSRYSIWCFWPQGL
ncbi:MAG: hypothetical protein ACE5Q6_06440 [Dehalococcoidia bacterium]